MLKFPKEPKCQICKIKEATTFVLAGQTYDKAKWWFTCIECNVEYEKYYFNIDKFLNSPPSTIDWLSHLHQKNWINWDNFMDMIIKFRKESDSFNS